MKLTMMVTAVFIFLSLSFFPFQEAHTVSSTQYWMKIRATDAFQRTLVANTGASIEATREDFVVAIGTLEEKAAIEKMGLLEVSFPLTSEMDFPAKDAIYHNYAEMTDKLNKLVSNHSDIAELSSIGKSIEGREIWAVRISGNLSQAETLPAAIFMGGHHAREHLSVELPLYYIEYFLTEYKNGNPRIQRLINGRDIHIIPMVNPDGAEFDISTGSYKAWRKNRAINGDGTQGVDLNRNYGFKWGTGGSSSSGSSDTFKGPHPFSEPETQAIKRYIEAHENITVLLSFHTFSQLILYPWGHANSGIPIARDRQVHEVMAKKMAEWNGYKPQQASQLYIASGDTTDWAYGEHKIIAFTFELDPGSSGFGPGGFYPGSGIIPEVQRKNLEPVLYLIEYADNPYRSLEAGGGPIFKP
ncbi:M14 family metallopeptidase [Bdellovibrio reynosensis]|uniref:M14 family metallopeptidase n=1 Tax=Bdellovibrio reynosensis TaxID=2835041 RepID=A0ABY4CFN0_9BACT|nr:M14 family metallopeptidase [Bdellovibrio reynosensis]UOF01015.1 M14 family metallopeptidase [Bdellovibrio reynosensis]